MNSKFSLESKVVVITGGSGLLGSAFSEAVCKARGTVIIAEKELARAEETVERIRDSVPGALIYPVEIDITDKEILTKAVESLAQKHGTIDALVNNAYPRNENYGRNFEDVTYEDFCENLGMNLGGYFITSQVFTKFFKQQGHGNIVNISSIYGVIPPKFEVYKDTEMTMPVEYAAIKSGLIHLTKYMAKYLKGENIRVNALCPGGILDSQDQQFVNQYQQQCLTKGMLDKDDLCGSLVFLLSDASMYINGQSVVVDDGFTL